MIADGIETVNVSALKITAVSEPMPLVNMWCPQTKKPSNAIATDEKRLIVAAASAGGGSSAGGNSGGGGGGGGRIDVVMLAMLGLAMLWRRIGTAQGRAATA